MNQNDSVLCSVLVQCLLVSDNHLFGSCDSTRLWSQREAGHV